MQPDRRSCCCCPLSIVCLCFAVRSRFSLFPASPFASRVCARPMSVSALNAQRDAMQAANPQMDIPSPDGVERPNAKVQKIVEDIMTLNIFESMQLSKALQKAMGLEGIAIGMGGGGGGGGGAAPAAAAPAAAAKRMSHASTAHTGNSASRHCARAWIAANLVAHARSPCPLLSLLFFACFSR